MHVSSMLYRITTTMFLYKTREHKIVYFSVIYNLNVVSAITKYYHYHCSGLLALENMHHLKPNELCNNVDLASTGTVKAGVYSCCSLHTISCWYRTGSLVTMKNTLKTFSSSFIIYIHLPANDVRASKNQILL